MILQTKSKTRSCDASVWEITHRWETCLLIYCPMPLPKWWMTSKTITCCSRSHRLRWQVWLEVDFLATMSGSQTSTQCSWSINKMDARKETASRHQSIKDLSILAWISTTGSIMTAFCQRINRKTTCFHTSYMMILMKPQKRSFFEPNGCTNKSFWTEISDQLSLTKVWRD